MTNVRSDTAERWEQELLSPQEIRPCWRKEINTLCIYVSCFLYICVFECAKGKVCLTNPPVHCESYVFVTLTMARWHKWKRFLFSSSVKHFYPSFPYCQRFCPIFTLCLILSLCISAFLTLSPTLYPCLPSSSLAFLLCFHFIINSMNIGIWAAENEEKGAASVEGEKQGLISAEKWG